MTDEEIRRDVLLRAGWEPHEVDRYLAEHPKPATYVEQSAIFSERLRDLGRAMWQERAAFVTLYVIVAFACVAALILL